MTERVETHDFYVKTQIGKKPQWRGKSTTICYIRITGIDWSVSEQRLIVETLGRSWSRSGQRENPGRLLSQRIMVLLLVGDEGPFILSCWW